MPGLEGIIAAIPTPFDANEELSLEALRSNLRRWNETPLAGYTVLGTTGEFVSLSTDEKKKVLETAREAVPEEKLFVAGTGSESTRETAGLTRWAASIGADYAILITPHYNRRSFTIAGLVDHYHRVAEESPIPIVVYHIPVCTGLSLEPSTVAKIAEHPNVAGIKDSAGDVFSLQEYKRLAREDFVVLTGSAQILLAALTVGAGGAILADACLAPEAPVALQRAFAAGNLERARAIQMRMVAFQRVAVGRYGIPGIKALLDHIGYYGGPPRRPLPPVDAQAESELQTAWNEIRGVQL